MKNFLLFGAILVGLVLVGVSALYFTQSANALPNFLPGYDANLTTHHIKHGIASLLLGLAFFAYAWFQSGKKSQRKSSDATTPASTQ